MILINGREIGTDAEGYLADLNDWSEELAGFLAERDNLNLEEAHWEIIRFMRNYFAEHGMAPNLRILTKLLKAELGEEKADKKYLFDLFPYGPAKQAARYAGMPKPTGCV
jgi:tRNA 2-thiouridine synthesizing protein E